MKATTKACSKWMHPEFIVDYEASIPQVDVDALILYLEQSVESGVRFEAGHTIQMGSMILRVAAEQDGFGLEEPDLEGVPIDWRLGVARTLKLLRLQKDTAESVGLGGALDFPSIRQSLIAGKDLSDESDAFVLERSATEGHDSGWFVGRADSGLDYQDPQNLRCISVYQSFLNWPRIAGFLALPVGSRTEIVQGRIDISLSGNVLAIRKKSFLDSYLS